MGGGRFHLTFPQHLIEEPTIYRIHSDFGLRSNIRRANVDDTAAWVILDLEGPDEDVERCLAWLGEQGVEVQRLDEGS
jgi:L-aspartate semialdehyde sulfurtransferase ferredoxin